MASNDFSRYIVHSRMQQRFNSLRAKLDAHRNRGPAFAAAVDELEKKLFKEVPCPEGENSPSADSPSTELSVKE